jgi:hypothetical protein
MTIRTALQPAIKRHARGQTRASELSMALSPARTRAAGGSS